MIEITNEEYHADDSRISKSGLDKIAVSPAHYKQNRIDRAKPENNETDAFRIGRVTHEYILEGKKNFVLKPTPGANELVSVEDLKRYLKTNGLKVSGSKPELIERVLNENENAPIYDLRKAEVLKVAKETGFPVISIEEFEEINAMREAVLRHPAAAELLTEGQAEQTFYFIEPETGAECKVRADWINNGVIVDLKTTIDASPKGFDRAVWKYRYDVQAAFYSDGVEHATGVPISDFVFVVVEKKPPFNVGVYRLSEERKERGKMAYIDDCATWVSCRNSNEWPGYSNEIIELA